MTKQEFLDNLRLSLNGRVPSEVLMENIRFYEDYINTEIRKGKSDEEVLEGLGDPRLIARTIVETKGVKDGRTVENDDGQMRQRKMLHLNIRYGLPAWIWLVLGILIVVVVLGVIFSFIAAILPVILPVLLVLLLIKVFRDWIN